MAGTQEGGKRAAETNIKKYGEDFYKKIGSKGGANGRTGGFYYSKVNGLDLHIEAGRKGGTISKRKARLEA
jgi:general stress protein YciG